MARKKPDETSAPTPPPAPKPKRAVPSVTVRMYRQGLGDCFLLSFPKRSGRFFILIDCGVIRGTPGSEELMTAVAKDIADTTKNHLDVLVATHEHWDHVSGFDQAKAVFKDITVDQVWLAWTEDPTNAIANKLRDERQARLNALWQGVHQLHLRLAATDAARDEFARAAEVLSFFGIDPTTDAPPAGGPAAGEGSGAKTAAAMAWVREKTPQPRFFTPGEQIDLKVTGGSVRVHVLGPPTDLKALRKDRPSSSHPETYEEDSPAAAERSLFGSLLGAAGAESVGFEPSQPFDRKYRIAPGDAARQDFFREHYLDERDAWRRLAGEWLAGAAELALQLDSDTNNTSLALAFELPDGRVL